MEYKGNKTYVKKLRSRSGTWFAFAVILMVLGIAFSIGWASRGPRIHDFTGIGQAKILTMNYISQGHGDRSDDRFVFDVQVTAGGETFACSEWRTSKPSWKVGDIVPVTYNVNNPREYVIDRDPKVYARWYKNIGILALILLISGLWCSWKSWRLYCLQKHLIGTPKE